MEIKDLMVGDWVYSTYHHRNIRITVYDFFTHGHRKDGSQFITSLCQPVIGRDLEPISLTPEILEKNGWVSDNYNDPFRVYNLRHGNKLYSTIAIADDGKWSIEVNKEIAKKDKRGRADGVVFIRDWCNGFCVHELQHALKLCGIEKEIVL